MKHIFLKPIGKIRELGTVRQWTTELLCVVVLVVVLWVLYVIS